MARIVFTADNHLGKHYARMTPDQLTKRRARLRQAWEATVDFALREGADVYLHGGDLFDNSAPRQPELQVVGRQLMRLRDAGVRVFMIGGNHDVPRSSADGATPQRLYEIFGVAEIFGRRQTVDWEVLTIDGLRLAIGGLPFDPRLGPEDDPLEDVAGLTPPEDADRAVLMLHYAVEGALHQDVNEPILTKERIASLSGIDLLLVGHIHERKVMTIGDVEVALCGPTERMNFGELHVKPGFVEAIIDQRGVRVKHHDTPAQPMRRETILTGNIPTDDPTEALMDTIRSISRDDQLLQVSLEGPMSHEFFHRLRWWNVRHLGQDLNFYFDLNREKMVVEGPAGLAVGTGVDRVSPQVEIEAVARSWADKIEDEDERALIDEALDLVLSRYRGDA